MKKFLLLGLIILTIYLYLAHQRIYQIIGETDKTLPHPFTTNQLNLVKNANSPVVTYVALGDSLTAGVGSSKINDTLPYLFAKNLNQQNLKIINLGIPGATTKEVIDQELNQAIKLQPQFISLLIGVNDVHAFETNTYFYQNYQQILDQLQTQTKAQITIFNIPAIGDDYLFYFPLKYIYNLKTSQFNLIISKLAREKNIPVINLYEINQKYSTQPGYYSLDHFHPSDQGYQIWGESLNASSNLGSNPPNNSL